MSYDLWSRLQYMLSPQFDIYEAVSGLVYGSVADIGCGTGFGTHLFTRHAKSVIGFDLDNSALSFAKRAFDNGSIRFAKTDITVGIQFEMFDVITMIDVIEHIREDRQAVENVHAALHYNGRFICSTPNALSRYRMSKYHIREYTPAELEMMLSEHFKVVDIVDIELKKVNSPYYNPIIAICRK